MAKIVLLHNHFDADHLAKVVEEMKVMGAPTIRVYDLGFDGLFQAVEGCHRLRACEILEIEPEIDVIDESTPATDIDCELEHLDTVAEMGDWENECIVF